MLNFIMLSVVALPTQEENDKDGTLLQIVYCPIKTWQGQTLQLILEYVSEEELFQGKIS
jgi:hypothetical protein